MAFDGIVIANLVKEFSDALTGGKIARSRRPSAMNFFYHKELPGDETASSLGQRKSPAGISDGYQQAGTDDCPNFCMLLRKHIGSGRIVSVSQPGLERCIHFEIEHHGRDG